MCLYTQNLCSRTSRVSSSSLVSVTACRLSSLAATSRAVLLLVISTPNSDRPPVISATMIASVICHPFLPPAERQSQILYTMMQGQLIAATKDPYSAPPHSACDPYSGDVDAVPCGYVLLGPDLYNAGRTQSHIHVFEAVHA